MYTCSIQSFKILASFCSWAGWFESYQVENSRRHIFAWCGSFGSVHDFVWHCTFILLMYRKNCKFWDTWNYYCNYPKIWSRWLKHTTMHPKDVEGIANSVDPDQTAPIGAFWSGSALFAHAYLSLIMRKPVFGVCDPGQLKPACAATEAS